MDYIIWIDNKKKCVLFRGVDFGHGVGCELPLWDHLERSGIVVVKKPGRTNWLSRLDPSVYCPAEFMVLQVIPGSVGDKIVAGWMRAKELVSFPIRKPKKTA